MEEGFVIYIFQIWSLSIWYHLPASLSALILCLVLFICFTLSSTWGWFCFSHSEMHCWLCSRCFFVEGWWFFWPSTKPLLLYYSSPDASNAPPCTSLPDLFALFCTYWIDLVLISYTSRSRTAVKLVSCLGRGRLPGEWMDCNVLSSGAAVGVEADSLWHVNNFFFLFQGCFIQ